MLADLVRLMVLVSASLVESDSGQCSLDSCPDSVSVRPRRTGPTDHWPTVANAGACRLEHCSQEMASCLMDPGCLELLGCPAACDGDSFVAGLCAYECGEAGTRSDTFLAMMTCWGTHRCQEARPQPAGACAALTIDEGHPGVTSLVTLRGGWRVVRAWNCAASGIQFASCQHWDIQANITTVSFTLAGPEGPVSKRIRQKQSLVWPGVIRGVYDETNGAMANLPQLEDYHIIDMDDTMEHLLIIWCHGMPEMSLNGALVLSRSGRNEDIPEETLQRFKTAIRNHGYEPEESCVFDNSNCNPK